MSGNLTEVHADSTRVGIRLGIAYLTGTLPSDQTVEALLASLPGSHSINVVAAPLAALLKPAGIPRGPAVAVGQDDLRRAYVMKAFEGMIHHTGDTSLLTKDAIEHLVEMSWHAARKHMELETVAAQLGTLTPPKETPA